MGPPCTFDEMHAASVLPARASAGEAATLRTSALAGPGPLSNARCARTGRGEAGGHKAPLRWPPLLVRFNCVSTAELHSGLHGLPSCTPPWQLLRPPRFVAIPVGEGGRNNCSLSSRVSGVSIWLLHIGLAGQLSVRTRGPRCGLLLDLRLEAADGEHRPPSSCPPCEERSNE